MTRLLLTNNTPFAAQIVPYQDVDGREHVVVVIKGSFALPSVTQSSGSDSTASAADAPVLALAEVQQSILEGDVFVGEAGVSSVRYESDLCPPKVATDVVVNGHVYAPPGETVPTIDATLQIGGRTKTVRAFGERRFFRAGRAWGITEPQPFSKIPLRYERAFGGKDDSVALEGGVCFEERNDIGVGFVAAGSTRDLDGLPLPNFEDPTQLIRAAGDAPAPAGFGFVARHWQPRRSLGGSYDETWRRSRCPGLPEDFDPRSFNGAPSDQTVDEHLAGGEEIALQALSIDGALRFVLPTHPLRVEFAVKRALFETMAVLDTVVIEPDDGRVLMTWRANHRIGRDMLYLKEVRIDEVQP